MKTIWGKIASFAVALILILNMASNVIAAPLAASEGMSFVALGDSVPDYVGVKEEQGYVSLLAEKLRNEADFTGISVTNLSKSGDDTKDLLNKLADEKNRKIIAGAGLITVCIGGNNFLGILDRLTGGIMDLSSLDSDEFLRGSLDLSGILSSDIILAMAARLLLQPEVQTQIAEGLAEFASDLPKIVSELKTIAPNAKIYFMTIYNPCPENSALYAVVDGPIKMINGYLEKNASDSTYELVDTYTAFNQFELGKDMLINSGLDVHPNVNGHKLIADVHYPVITGMVSNVKTVYSENLDNDLFSPELSTKPLTRAEAIGLIMDGLNANFGGIIDFKSLAAGTDAFGDVPAKHPQYNQILAAKSFGFISGAGNNMFNPDTLITRQDYACIVDRVYSSLSNLGVLPPLNTDIGEYADSATAASYARNSISKVAASSLITVSDNTLNPLGSVTTYDLILLYR